MTEKKWISGGIGIIFLFMCLTACSGGKASLEDSQEFGYVSTISQVDLQGKLVRNAYLCGEELVYQVGSEFYILPVLEPDAEPKKLNLQFSDGRTYVYDMEKGADGNYYTLESATEGAYVCVYDAEGERLNKWGISQWLLEAGAQTQVQELALDGQGNIYVRGYETLMMMDSAGHYQGCLSERTYHMTCGSDGQIYYVCRGPGGNSQMKKIDFATAQSETVCSRAPDGVKMFLGEGGEPWVFDSHGIYQSGESDSIPEQIFNWLEVDVDGTIVRDVELLSDGRILAVTFSFEYNHIQPLELIYIARADGKTARKKTITVAVMSITNDMLAATVQYNKEHTDYRVVLKEYAGLNGYRDREDAVAAMDLDLVSGAKLDIISVDYPDLEKYASKGILEDLGVYLDKGGGLRREELVETIVDAYTLDGKLMALPTWFRLRMIVGKQSMLGDRDCWSIADMAAFYEEYQDSRVLQSASPQNMLEICMKYNQSYFVDWEKGSCDFDREEFYQLLEFAGRFRGEDKAYNREWGVIRQEDGEALLSITGGVRPYFISTMPQWFSGEEVNYIGYPVLDGKPGILLDTSFDSYGILSSSAHKEQAWDYLEYVIRAKGESDEYFSVLRDKLDQMLEASMEDPYERDSEGELILDEEGNPRRRILLKETYSGTDIVIYDYVPLPEEIDKVRELISLARPAPGYHEVVMDIIMEEVAGYFAGDKDAKDVAAMIQNRVQLYLNEQK